MWWESCSTGRACFRLLLHEKPTGLFTTPATRAWAVPHMRSEFNQTKGRGSWAPQKEGNQRSVTAASSSLARGADGSARAIDTELLTRSSIITWCCSTHLSKAMIQCLQGVLDSVQMHRLIARHGCVWLLTEGSYTHSYEHSEKLNHQL